MTSLQPAIGGSCTSRYDRVRDALEVNIGAGVEIGASLYVDVAGEPAVDIWGGWRNRERTVDWDEDTLVTVWSTTKTVTAMAVLALVDRGELDVNAPVSKYWPEFAANGKQRVLVRHLLSHTSGVSGWEQPFRNEDAYDLPRSTARLAEQAPWWEPGTASAYHATTFGHLNGELVRRVTGRSLGQFIAEDIAGPVGADFHLGLDDADFERVATVYAPILEDMAASLPQDHPEDAAGEPVFDKTLKGTFASIDLANTPEFRRAEMGGTSGHGNARSIARILSAVTLGGESQGERLLSPRTIDQIFACQADGVDLFLNIPLRWGTGFALAPSAGVPFVRDGRVCFWGGWGGSMIIMDLDRRLTISYVMNQMQPGTIGSELAAAYCDVIYRCFDQS